MNGEFFIPALPGKTPGAEGYFGAYGGNVHPGGAGRRGW